MGVWVRREIRVGMDMVLIRLQSMVDTLANSLGKKAIGAYRPRKEHCMVRNHSMMRVGHMGLASGALGANKVIDCDRETDDPRPTGCMDMMANEWVVMAPMGCWSSGRSCSSFCSLQVESCEFRHSHVHDHVHFH